MDEEVLDMLQVKESKIEKKPKQLRDGNKALDLKKLEFVGDDYLKGKVEKQNYIYDTPGIFNESQVCMIRLNSVKKLKIMLKGCKTSISSCFQTKVLESYELYFLW